MTEFYPEFAAMAVLTVSLITYACIRFPIYKLKGYHFAHPEVSADGNVPVSVVVVVRSQTDVLEQNLEALASQNYPSYEIIIVNDTSVDGAGDTIKRMCNKFPHIRQTFLPASARYVSRFKLAVTLGVKAARNEWILLTEGDCRPTGSDWLGRMVAACDDEHDIVLGYTAYTGSRSLRGKRHALDSLVRQLRFFRAAAGKRNGKAVGGFLSNIAFRKSLFMENRGFASGLELMGGEEALFVDAAARPGRTGVVVCDETIMNHLLPMRRGQWHTLKLFQAESGLFLSRHGRAERRRWGLSGVCLYVSLLAMAVLAGLFLLKMLYLPAAIAVLVELLFILVDDILFSRASARVGEGRFLFMYPCYSLTQPFYNWHYRISGHRHRRRLMRGL